MASHIVRPPLRASNLNVVRRRITSGIVAVLAVAATIAVVTPLIAILLYLLKQGVSSLNWDFFTKVPVPVGEKGGGMENAIVGSGVILALASAIGIPLGIGAGIYLAEFGGSSRMGNLVRFTADVLNGVPAFQPAVFADAEGVVPPNANAAPAPAGAGRGGGAGGRGGGNPAAVQEIRAMLQGAPQNQPQ